MKLFPLYITVVLALASLLHAGELPAGDRAVPQSPSLGSLAKVMDAFLRAYAADTPAFRTEIKFDSTAEKMEPPPGFQKAHSEIAGWYFFRPKSSDLLSQEERRALVRDRRFQSFLAQQRRLTDDGLSLDQGIIAAGKAIPASPSSPPPQVGRAEIMARMISGRASDAKTTYFSLTAEELVEPGPIVVSCGRAGAP